MLCESCEALVINGVLCHERGCPDAWRDEVRECKNCDCTFTPEHKGQEFCGDECYQQYWGLDTEDFEMK